MNQHIKYTDETDKSFGIAGMAISLVACDAEEMLSAVSLEPDEESFDLANELFFISNPRFSAKIAWNELLKQYRIFSAMALGNLLCRRAAKTADIADEIVEELHRMLIDEGCEYCSLEHDEAEMLYDKHSRYYRRLFAHPGVMTIARDFATNLRMRRRMTGGEVLEQLARLNSL